MLVVPLLYDLVRRGHGRWARLAAALAFAGLAFEVKLTEGLLRWARARSTDVSLDAGLPRRGILYRLPAAGSG
jgi:hypothetical protein